MKNFININDVSDYKKLVNQAIELKKSKQNNISFNKKTLGLIFFNPSLSDDIEILNFSPVRTGLKKIN